MDNYTKKKMQHTTSTYKHMHDLKQDTHFKMTYMVRVHNNSKLRQTVLFRDETIQCKIIQRKV